jgi:FHS family L-fucose permease-like MFS transporter
VVQGKVLDATSPAVSFIVPAVCFAVVTAYAVYDLRAEPVTPVRSAADEVAS